ncbi:MAG: ATP-binding protein [Candidatus Cloacimonadaceae bacterium]|nr:ATP-binding protein [Candidatus Cloacimonadota bacterium]MDY0326607.1 ATP-binding protein [Candidatus Cloacimonadaceae bacterium]
MDEALSFTEIHSLASISKDLKSRILTTRIFHSPHHTISDVAVKGGSAEYTISASNTESNSLD